MGVSDFAISEICLMPRYFAMGSAMSCSICMKIDTLNVPAIKAREPQFVALALKFCGKVARFQVKRPQTGERQKDRLGGVVASYENVD